MTHADAITSQRLTAALAAAERGWHVFPLRPYRKTPALPRDWEGLATTDRSTLRRWFGRTAYNIGIATGPSNLVVVDLDSAPAPSTREGSALHGRQTLSELAWQAGEVLPADTFTVITPRGGQHLYFIAPQGIELRNTAGRLGPHVDTRARGGYVVAPGSVVDGRDYRITCDLAPAPLPAWLRKLLHTPTRPGQLPADAPESPASPTRVRAYADAALRAEARNVEEAPVGLRNHTLFVAAARMGGLTACGMLTADAVRSALTTACTVHLGVAGLHQEEVNRTITSGLRRGLRTPRRTARS